MIEDAPPPVGSELSRVALDAEARINRHDLIDLEIVDVERGVTALWEFCVRCRGQCLRCERKGTTQDDLDQWPPCRPLLEISGVDST